MKKIIIPVIVLALLVTAGVLIFNKKSQTTLDLWEHQIMKQLKDKEFHKPVDLPIEDQEKLKSSCNDFFSAITNYDMDELSTILGSRPEFKYYQEDVQILKNSYSDIAEITFGEPFKVDSNLYPGVYIPYKIRFKNGHIKEWQVAIKYSYDNGKILWYLDGGI